MRTSYLDAPDVLVDGHWETRGAVKVWVPWDAAEFYRFRTGDACGTNRGYQRHRRDAGEPPCSPCRIAHNATEKAGRVRRELG